MRIPNDAKSAVLWYLQLSKSPHPDQFCPDDNQNQKHGDNRNQKSDNPPSRFGFIIIIRISRQSPIESAIITYIGKV